MMMKTIVSWNINGMRSCIRNGYINSLWNLNADMICLQEVKLSDMNDVNDSLPKGYHCYGNLSSDKGRNGVLIISKKKTDHVMIRTGNDRLDAQGRFIQADYDGFTLINLYMPHGGRDKKSLPFKIEVFETMQKYFQQIADNPVVVATDFNMAAGDIDVCNAEKNRKNIMFTEEERQMVASMSAIGYTDIYRALYPDKKEYTWWSYAFDCRKRNIGWRIDYFWVTKTMIDRIEDVIVANEIFGSDHCPIIMKYRG